MSDATVYCTACAARLWVPKMANGELRCVCGAAVSLEHLSRFVTADEKRKQQQIQTPGFRMDN